MIFGTIGVRSTPIRLRGDVILSAGPSPLSERLALATRLNGWGIHQVGRALSVALSEPLLMGIVGHAVAVSPKPTGDDER